MRTMFLLYGAPGSGKSRFASTNFVQGMTISRADCEKIMSPSITCFDGVSKTVRANTKRFVDSMILEAVKTRASLGATIVLDDVENVKISVQKKWMKLMSEYGYEVVIVDVQGEQSLCELQEKASLLGNVSPEIVEHYFKNRVFHSSLRVIDNDSDFRREFSIPTVDHGDTKTMIVGDVQSASSRLRKLVEEYDEPNMKWVFTGDLFDRGENPYEVYQIVNSLGARATKIMGNHDEHIYDVLREPDGKRYVQTRKTVAQLMEQGLTRDSLTRWVKSFIPFYDFRVFGYRYFATHGGVSLNKLAVDEDSINVMTTPSDISFIQGTRNMLNTRKGIGMYVDNIDFLLAEDSSLNQMFEAQFHGHRNSGCVEADAIEGVYNLESRAEDSDGWLTSVLITEDGCRVIKTF